MKKEIEEFLIGKMLEKAGDCQRITCLFTPEEFENENTRFLFEAAINCRLKNKPFTVDSLSYIYAADNTVPKMAEACLKSRRKSIVSENDTLSAEVDRLVENRLRKCLATDIGNIIARNASIGTTISKISDLLENFKYTYCNDHR